MNADGQHGLIASLADQNSGLTSNDANNSIHLYPYAGAQGDGIYAGIANTSKIVAEQNALATIDSSGPPSSAAQVADDYSVQDDGVSSCTGAASETCWGDWYLPSKFELNLLYQQQASVGGFTAGFYCSSTDSDYLSVYSQSLDNGTSYILGKSRDNNYYRVRAVRAF